MSIESTRAGLEEADVEDHQPLSIKFAVPDKEVERGDDWGRRYEPARRRAPDPLRALSYPTESSGPQGHPFV